ncbi:hypothetical protein PAECIP111892_01169 [Paenibacillus auburnensis]|uniref:Uncharacterized protein n=1 Tax=Paenibacillus auburnensis TaxID=2905649 RepID=A0ABN8FVK4_9BACL|nr:hypothetical protein PAECIP111892_01169 [Paenibacillus auburnensis]
MYIAIVSGGVAGMRIRCSSFGYPVRFHGHFVVYAGDHLSGSQFGKEE